MKAIEIRDVIVQDLNENNLYDSDIDEVTNRSGQILTPQEKSQKLNAILAELKAPEWKGLALSRVSIYLQCLRDAKNSAFLGEVQETHNSLGDAEEEARLLSLPFDSQQAFQWKHQALTNSMNSHLRIAQKAARIGGNAEEVKNALETAKQEATDLNRLYQDPVVFDQNAADQTLKTAFLNQIQHLYGEAAQSAKEGKIGTVKWNAKEIRYWIGEAYRRFNLRLRFDQTRVDRALKEAFTYGIPHEYKEAETLAAQGQTRQVRLFLTKIQSHIQEANQKFSLGISYDQKRADNIMADALVNGVSDNFKLARGYAKGRSLFYATQWLKTAQQYVNEYNQKYAGQKGRPSLVFDQTRANEILQCAQGLSLCPP